MNLKICSSLLLVSLVFLALISANLLNAAATRVTGDVLETTGSRQERYSFEALVDNDKYSIKLLNSAGTTESRAYSDGVQTVVVNGGPIGEIDGFPLTGC